MKKRYLIIILVFAYSFSKGQLPLYSPEWDMRYGGDFNDWFADFKQTNDGGFILGSYAYSGIGGDVSEPNRDTTHFTSDYWIIKVNEQGVKQWDKKYGGNKDDRLSVVLQSNDGGYILAGSSNSDMSDDKTENCQGSYDYWIVKTDEFGNKQWDRRFGGNQNDLLTSAVQTPDNGFLFSGYSRSGMDGDKTQPNRDSSNSTNDFWIIKTDLNGNKQWDRRYGGVKEDVLYSLLLLPNNEYLLAGTSSSDADGDKSEPSWNPTSPHSADYWIIKVDSSGNKLWDKRYGGFLTDVLKDALHTRDKGFLLLGWSHSWVGGDKTVPPRVAGSTGSDYWLVKIDSTGGKEWDAAYGGNSFDALQTAQEYTDGGYLLVGTSRSEMIADKTESNMGITQAWVVKINATGILQWDKTIFTNGNDFEETGIKVLADGCFMIANTTASGIGGYKTQLNRGDTTMPLNDFWLIKFCPSTVDVSNIISEQSLSLSPNPATNTLHCSLTETPPNTTAYIYATDGRLLVPNIPVTQANFEIGISALPTGLYFLVVQNEKQRAVKRFVKTE